MVLNSSAFVAEPDLIQALLERAIPVDCREDVALFHQGDVPVGVYILEAGEATMTLENASGIQVAMAPMVPGALLGLPAIVGNKPYSMTAVARAGAQVGFVTGDSVYGSGNYPDAPTINQVAPSPIVIGSSGPMAIGGSGFSGFPGGISVQLSGSGVTVSGASAQGDNVINATYSVAPNATAGTQNLTVVFNGPDGQVPTNSIPVTIAASAPVPGKASIDSQPMTTYSKQTWTSCNGQSSQANAYGYQYCLIYQIETSGGTPIYQNYTVQESVTTIASNIPVNMNSGNNVSNPTGQFSDQWSLIGTSAIPANACNVVKQTITVAGYSNPIRVNCLKYGQSGVTLTDVTANPNQCSAANYTCP